jgi:hypothetical protein
MTDWFDGNGTGDPVDVTKILDGLAAAGIAEMVGAGALVSLGTTSDGGALGLTVTVDGRYRREYFRDEDTLLAWIAEAIPAVHDAKATSSPPRAQQKRTRRSGKL